MEEESILNTIKKMLGIDDDCQSFDQELIVFINSVFPTLYQIGVTEVEDFFITSFEQTWSDIDIYQPDMLNMIKSYIYMKVRMLFDPPTTSFVLESLNNQTKELEWRIYIESEGGFDDECDKCEREHSHSLRCSRDEMGN